MYHLPRCFAVAYEESKLPLTCDPYCPIPSRCLLFTLALLTFCLSQCDIHLQLLADTLRPFGSKGATGKNYKNIPLRLNDSAVTLK